MYRSTTVLSTSAPFTVITVSAFAEASAMKQARLVNRTGTNVAALMVPVIRYIEGFLGD
jgi:hypothetical protein